VKQKPRDKQQPDLGPPGLPRRRLNPCESPPGPSAAEPIARDATAGSAADAVAASWTIGCRRNTAPSTWPPRRWAVMFCGSWLRLRARMCLVDLWPGSGNGAGARRPGPHKGRRPAL